MATKPETECMYEIEIVVIHWKLQSIPTWRAIEKIAALILGFQKTEYEREHK